VRIRRFVRFSNQLETKFFGLDPIGETPTIVSARGRQSNHLARAAAIL
jgi:hypothetical protein